MTRRKSATVATVFLLLLGVVQCATPRTLHAQIAAPVRLAEEYESDEGRGEADDQPQVVPPATPSVQPSVPQNANAAGGATTTTTAPAAPAPNPTPSTEPTPAITSADAADEAGASTDAELTPVISTEFPWAWIITRAAGITSYVLLGVLSLTGMLLSTGTFFRAFEPATAWSIHRAIASVLLFSVLTHVGSLLFDKFIGLRLLDVLVPFVSPYRPLLVALGILGFYLLLLVLATSLYTMNRYPRFWRIVHYFSFVMFVSIFFHGILIGTDAKVLWVRLIYWCTAALVVGLGTYRLWWKHHQEPALARAKI